MEQDIYLYPGSQSEAHRLGEAALWDASFHANVSCARDIEAVIRVYGDGRSALKPEASQTVLKRWGFKRTNFVLAQPGRNSSFRTPVKSVRFHLVCSTMGIQWATGQNKEWWRTPCSAVRSWRTGWQGRGWLSGGRTASMTVSPEVDTRRQQTTGQP